MSEHEEQVDRDEDQPELLDAAKEAIREAAEEGYEPPRRSESMGEETESSAVAPEEEQKGDALTGESADRGQKLDLNTASVEDLTDLSGIGSILAKRIVSYREEEGPFREASEITRVPGVAELTYEALADRITVVPIPGQEPEAAEELPEEEEAEEAPIQPREEVPEEPEATEGVLVPAAEEALPPPTRAAEAQLGIEREREEAEEGDGEEIRPDVVPPAREVEQPAAAPLPPSEERARPAPPPEPRGGGWGRLLLVGLLSTLAGALLALLVLFLLNGGTLGFRRATARAIDREVTQLESQLSEQRMQLEAAEQRLDQLAELSQQIDEMQSSVDGLQTEIGGLQERLASLQSELTATSEGLGDVRQTLAGLSDDLTSMAESMTLLEGQVAEAHERLGELDEELVDLRTTTDRFDAFLLGLRRLLEDNVPESMPSQPTEETSTSTPELTPTPTPYLSPTATPSGASPTPESWVTVIPLATPVP